MLDWLMLALETTKQLRDFFTLQVCLIIVYCRTQCVIVSDVSDDVRRAAVTALGFVLYRQPEQCPKVVALLAESYNPHVRYGACLALGIACGSTGLKEAIDVLEPLTNDMVDFVRQGALISLAMVLMQHTKKQVSRVEQIRKLFEEKINGEFD